MNEGYNICRMDIVDNEWRKLLAPCQGSYIAFYNEGGMDMQARTDPEDASTQFLISGNTQEVVAAPHTGRKKIHRWDAGDVIAWLKQSTPGTSTVVLKIL